MLRINQNITLDRLCWTGEVTELMTDHFVTQPALLKKTSGYQKKSHVDN